MKGAYFLKKIEIKKIAEIKNYVGGENEFQLFGVADYIIYNDWVFFTNKFIYSVPQEVSVGSVSWEARDMYEKATEFRNTIRAHMSVHRHVGRFGFSDIDRGEGGVLNRFVRAQNLYQIDWIIYTPTNSESEIADLEICYWDKNGEKRELESYYFILNDLDENNNGNEENLINLDIDLETGKKVVTPRTIISQYTTNFKINSKIDKTLLAYMISFINSSNNVIFDIEKEHFKIKRLVPYISLFKYPRLGFRWYDE